MQAQPEYNDSTYLASNLGMIGPIGPDPDQSPDHTQLWQMEWIYADLHDTHDHNAHAMRTLGRPPGIHHSKQ